MTVASSTVFGAKAQVIVGVFAFTISGMFWVLGTVTIPHAASLPWNWTPAAFIFHASMFALVVASYAIIATGLGFRATERVESQVTP
jgi:ABC-type Na+ efflux pump permease subunit